MFGGISYGVFDWVETPLSGELGRHHYVVAARSNRKADALPDVAVDDLEWVGYTGDVDKGTYLEDQ